MSRKQQSTHRDKRADKSKPNLGQRDAELERAVWDPDGWAKGATWTRGTLFQATGFKPLSDLKVNPMRLHTHLLIACGALAFSYGPATAQNNHTYSKAVQKACAHDYKQHCGEYGIETDALRLCMDKAGHSLSKTCVDALVDAGEVSKEEVERRKKTGH